MYEIPNYSKYYFDSNINLIDKKSNKIMKLHNNTYKIKNDTTGKFQYKARSALLASIGLVLQIPSTAKKVPNTDYYYIDIDSVVYSFGPNNPTGLVLVTSLGTSGYPTVGIVLKDGTKKLQSVHTLMIKTFIMEDYIEKGLCCMHLNNIKTDNRLSNLAVGTYSQNNKQAYTDGLNPGNGLKKIK